MRRFRTALAATSIAVLAAPAEASIPGNIEERAREGLLHVCIDTEPLDDEYVVCTAQDSDAQSLYTGAECTGAGLPASCTIDFIPKVKITGRLLLVNDEFALDAVGDPIPQGQTAIFLELKKGGKKATLIELFGGTKLGNWNGFAEDLLPSDSGISYTNQDETVFQFANDNLTDLGLEVRALASDWFKKADLSEAVPVLTVLTRHPKRAPLDHPGFDDPVASAAWFKIVIQFARVRP